MRTLQRLAHVKPLAPGEAEQLHDERIRGARRDHRATWWRHARRVLVVLCAVGLLLGGKHWLLGRRIVVDGLVRATTHVALAESEGRVRWDVRAGQRVRRGDVLGRIDAAATGAGGPELQRAARLPLELAVDEAAQQLELARNRPSAAHTEQLRLLDELVEARNEAEIARAQSEAARASLGERVESRTVLELSLRAGRVESERRADELIHLAGAARAAELEA